MADAFRHLPPEAAERPPRRLADGRLWSQSRLGDRGTAALEHGSRTTAAVVLDWAVGVVLVLSSLGLLASVLGLFGLDRTMEDVPAAAWAVPAMATGWLLVGAVQPRGLRLILSSEEVSLIQRSRIGTGRQDWPWDKVRMLRLIHVHARDFYGLQLVTAEGSRTPLEDLDPEAGGWLAQQLGVTLDTAAAVPAGDAAIAWEVPVPGQSPLC